MVSIHQKFMENKDVFQKKINTINFFDGGDYFKVKKIFLHKKFFDKKNKILYKKFLMKKKIYIRDFSYKKILKIT